ncbi:unnamed protein product [Psylliodes chrysocephalus]|uniref:Uncharacterized protein n=1 Tax=Psylliodes chrysocephalus TaxID=3402493 RepID=A0A9P0CQV0_9CUCU|nr:unnamed protein product [Psylliodes chrysocephala]
MADSKAGTSLDVLNTCVRCKKSVGTGIRCKICGILSHKSCLKSLKTVKIIDNEYCICCQGTGDRSALGTQTVTPISCNSDIIFTENVPEIEILRNSVKHLESLLTEREKTIKYQDVAIKSLTDQIDLMKKVNTLFNNSSVSTNSKNQFSYTTTESLSVLPAVNNAEPQIKLPDVRSAVHLAQTKMLCDETINLRDNVSAANSSTPTSRSGSIFIGTHNGLEDCPLKAAESRIMRHFHVTNFNIDVTVINLKTYLSQFASEVVVQKLNSKSPEHYSSFKVSVPTQQTSSILLSRILSIVLVAEVRQLKIVVRSEGIMLVPIVFKERKSNSSVHGPDFKVTTSLLQVNYVSTLNSTNQLQETKPEENQLTLRNSIDFKKLNSKNLKPQEIVHSLAKKKEWILYNFRYFCN